MLPPDVGQWPSERVIAWLLEQFPGKVALACSFQKEETVLLDMLFALEPKARVFAIDTHYLFPETYAYWREVEQRYGTSIEVFAGPSQEELEAVHGERLWEHKPDLYLAVTKVAPLVTALGGLDAWITGIRRDQSPTRANGTKDRLGRAARAVEGEPTRGLDGRDVLGLHPRAGSRTTHCTTGVTPRSATHIRRSRAKVDRDAGPAPTKRSAASIPSRRRT